MAGGLGRLPAEDPRDLNFLMRAANPSAFATPLSLLPPRRVYARGRILDQGQTSTCVEFSLENKLRGTPVVVSETRLPPRYSVYDAAIKLDEFPDNDSDIRRQMGTSVRAGCKVLQGLGFIGAYHWAYSVDEILQWILSGQGGVNLGIDWYSGMNTPNQGVIRATGRVEGGHAIYAFGADRSEGMLYLEQTWGIHYGGWLDADGGRINRGCIKLPLDDLALLLRGNGEAVAITEIPYHPLLQGV